MTFPLRRLGAGAAVVTTTLVVMAITSTFAQDSAAQQDRTFYLSPAGNDSASGTSLTQPWRSLERLAEAGLRAGDTVRLESGATFSGQLNLDGISGTAERPIRVSVTGEAPATLLATGDAGISMTDAAHIELSGLSIRPAGPTVDQPIGIRIVATAGRQDGLALHHLSLSGFDTGILAGADAPGSGTQGLSLRDLQVDHSVRNGINLFGPAGSVDTHRHVTIQGVTVTGTTGVPGEGRNTGSGIVLGAVTTAIVEDSETSHNGARSDAAEGPLGLWAYSSADVTFRNNLSTANRTAEADGGGYGFDLDVANSVMYGNISRDNDGPGYLVYSKNGEVNADITVRDNISVNDARRDPFYGAITVLNGLPGYTAAGVIRDVAVTGNTVVTDAAYDSPLLRIGGDTAALTISNNLFVHGSDGEFIAADGNTTPSEVTWCGNAFVATAGPRSATLSSAHYPDIADWIDRYPEYHQSLLTAADIQPAAQGSMTTTQQRPNACGGGGAVGAAAPSR